MLTTIESHGQNLAFVKKELQNIKIIGERLENYKKIQKIANLKFWISGAFPYGFRSESMDYKDLSDENIKLHTLGTLSLKFSDHKAFYFDGTSSILSDYKFQAKYTFFLLAKKYPSTNNPGRIFTSRERNNVVGWWRYCHKILWLEGNLHTVKNVDTEEEIHLWILWSDGYNIKYWDGNNVIPIINLNYITRFDNIVIGQPILFKDEALKGYVYETICFNRNLIDSEIKEIKDLLSIYYKYE